MAVDKSEKKGIVYEAFVKLAFERHFKKTIKWEPPLSGIIAKQDLAYLEGHKPQVIFAVTYWGSHEAANKKTWRTLEDRFECYNAYPKASFVSVVFEKNSGSDDALDDIINRCCLGCSLSERQSAALVGLQVYVDSDEKVCSFGSGHDEVFAEVVDRASRDKEFRELILSLGRDIARVLQGSLRDKGVCKRLLENIRARRVLNIDIGKIVSGKRATFLKKSIISLLGFSDNELENIIAGVRENRYCDWSSDLLRRLLSRKLIRIVGITRRIVPSPALRSVSETPSSILKGIFWQIEELVNDERSESGFYFYKDHYCDVADNNRRATLYSYFKNIKTASDIESVEHALGEIKTRHVWVLDYYLAFKRFLTKGKYGLQKLSDAVDIPYLAGGISPLPMYVAGTGEGLTKDQKSRLLQFVAQDISSFDFSKLPEDVIIADRSVVLMKKLNLLEVLVQNALARGGIPRRMIVPQVRLTNPFRRAGAISSAGATDFNLKISNGERSVLVFVISAYGASHKHKEVSARVRVAQTSKDFPRGDVKCVVVLDGTLFQDSKKVSAERKIEMMGNAGWTHVYYADELEIMAKEIKEFLAASKSEADSLDPSKRSDAFRMLRPSLLLAAEGDAQQSLAVEDDLKSYGKKE